MEGSSCVAPYQVKLGGGTQGYHPIDPYAAGPLVTDQGILLHHTPIGYESPCSSCAYWPDIFRLSAEGLEDLGGGFGFVSDANAIQIVSGKKLAFSLQRVWAWFEPEDGIDIINWSGRDALGLNLAELTGPPISVGNVIYSGIRFGGGQSVFFSTDQGNSWKENLSDIRIGDDRFNLLENPEQDALWAIKSEGFGPSGLFESTNHGSTWTKIDDYSFPPHTVRVIHDPENELVSYALSDSGLFISTDRGVSWQVTSLEEAIHGLVFVERLAPLPRALVAGTNSGVKVSVDEGMTWVNMSGGLIAQPHTVKFAHGQLLAIGDGGYFTCNTVDCGGQGQELQYKDGAGIVEVIEFYNTALDHYFITAVESEVTAIEQGAAGDGWVRTGEKFLAWSLGASADATNVCRFYGSISPGPNSHFYSVSPQECRFQMDLQELVPHHRPRWNFEGYAFSILPPASVGERSCPESSVPVYRAYNNGYKKGEDSNHRYMTNLGLMDEMVAKGWVDEGVVFCSPTN